MSETPCIIIASKSVVHFKDVENGSRKAAEEEEDDNEE
jgi:hypothetical protein